MQRLSRLFISCFALLVLLTSFSAEAATLHAVLVCDTTADNIAESVQADYTTLHNELTKIASNTSMGYNEISFTGNGIDADILDKINQLGFGTDDVVFFYFSGHGYRTDSKGGNQWPNMYLTPVKRGIDLLEVVTLLRAKQPRLLLAIADSCNNVIPDKFAPPLINVRRQALMMKAPSVKSNYKQLFLNSAGTIIISGCIPGQVSWGTQTGGVYTLSFFHSLNEEVRTSYNPEWGVLLDRASINVINMDFEQIPQYELQVK